MGILLGLATALSWGSADLLARFAARKIGTFRTMLYMQLTGLVLLTLVLRWLGGWGHLADGSGFSPWAWGILVGTLNTGATLALYRSFEIGTMSIVAPISASYPALTMLLSATSGERLTPARMAGCLLILLGVLVVARGAGARDDASSGAGPGQRENRNLGVGWALFASIGFGVMFWILGIRAVPLLGSAQTVWIIRLTSVVLTAATIAILRQPVAPPKEGAKGWVLGIGILDTGAYVLNNYGIQHEQLSVMSVLASLYGAVTVGLAAVILGERVSRMRWLGILTIFVGIALVSR
jgi:drug/metabolite transporter (DMT)-like permease